MDVGCCDPKPCRDGDKLMFRTSISSILGGLQRREMGL